MSYRELTAADFADKSPEDIAAMVSENEAGLRNKNTELLGKFDEYKGELGQKESAIEEERKRNLELETKQLVDAGKYEDALKLEREQNAKEKAALKASDEKTKSLIKQRDLKDVHFDILSKVSESLQAPAQAMLDKMTDINYGENGEVNKSIKWGDKEFSNTVDFLAHAETDATWKAMLKAPETKGLNVHNSNAQGSGNSKMTLTEQAIAANKANA